MISPAGRANIHDKLAHIYLRAKDYPKATEQLQAIVQDDPANPEAFYLLGSLADEQKSFAAGRRVLSKNAQLERGF